MKLAFFIIVIVSSLPTCGPNDNEQVATTKGVEKMVAKCVKAKCYQGLVDFFDEGVGWILKGLGKVDHSIQIPKGSPEEIAKAIEDFANEILSQGKRLSALKGRISKAIANNHVRNYEGLISEASTAINEIDEKMMAFDKVKRLAEFEVGLLGEAKEVLINKEKNLKDLKELGGYLAKISKIGLSDESLMTRVAKISEEIEHKLKTVNDALEEVTNRIARLTDDIAELDKVGEKLKKQKEAIADKIDELEKKFEDRKPAQASTSTKSSGMDYTMDHKEAVNNLKDHELVIGVEEWEDAILSSKHRKMAELAQKFAVKIATDIEKGTGMDEIIKKATYRSEGNQIGPGGKFKNLYQVSTRRSKSHREVYQLNKDGDVGRFYFCVKKVAGVRHLIFVKNEFTKNKGGRKAQKSVFKAVHEKCIRKASRL